VGGESGLGIAIRLSKSVHNMRSSKHPTSVFNPDHLNRLSHRDRSGSAFSEAENAGPWSVRQWRDGFAVLREADGGAGTPDAVFTERETALLMAAVYPTMGREQRFQITAAGAEPAPTSTPSSAASSRRLAGCGTGFSPPDSFFPTTSHNVPPLESSILGPVATAGGDVSATRRGLPRGRWRRRATVPPLLAVQRPDSSSLGSSWPSKTAASSRAFACEAVRYRF